MSKDREYPYPTEEMNLFLRLIQQNILEKHEMSLLVDLMVNYIQLRKLYMDRKKDEP